MIGSFESRINSKNLLALKLHQPSKNQFGMDHTYILPPPPVHQLIHRIKFLLMAKIVLIMFFKKSVIEVS